MAMQLGLLDGGIGLCLLFLLFLSEAAAAAAVNAEPRAEAELGRRDSFRSQEKCNYTILIETTCGKGAGTASQVSLRFGDANSGDVLVPRLRTKHAKRVDKSLQLDDVPTAPFLGCSTDVFEVAGNCIRSQVCYLYLKLRGDDDWRPGRAQVLVSGSAASAAAAKLSSETFYFRRFLPRRVWHGIDACDAKVTAFGVKQRRKEFIHE